MKGECQRRLNPSALPLLTTSQMSPYMRKSWQSERHAEPLVNWTPDTAGHKRKRQERDGQGLQPPKRSKGPLKVNWRHGQSQDQSWDQKTPDRTQATPSPGSSQASFTHVATDEGAQDLPELTYSESMSPPDTDELHSMDDLFLSQNVLLKELHYSLSTYVPDSRHTFPHTASAVTTTSMEEYTRKP